jgi:hypothetical protein
MDNIPNEDAEITKKEQQMRKLRPLWMVLIAGFTIVILLNLYNWSQGDGNLRGIVAPLGMIFLGLMTLTSPRNKALSYIFLVIAATLVITGLVMAIIDFSGKS